MQATLGPIIRGRHLSLPSKALDHPDPRQALRAVLKAWLPLSETVLAMAVAHLPSPVAAAPFRAPHLLSTGHNHLSTSTFNTSLNAEATTTTTTSSNNNNNDHNGSSSSSWQGAGGGQGEGAVAALSSSSSGDEAVAVAAQQLERVKSSLSASSSGAGAPTIIFVSKMISVPANLLPRRPGEGLMGGGGSGNGEVFLAFGRVFSGVAREGARVHVLSAAYDPGQPQQHRQTAVLRGLYLMMGR